VTRELPSRVLPTRFTVGQLLIDGAERLLFLPKNEEERGQLCADSCSLFPPVSLLVDVVVPVRTVPNCLNPALNQEVTGRVDNPAQPPVSLLVMKKDGYSRNGKRRLPPGFKAFPVYS